MDSAKIQKIIDSIGKRSKGHHEIVYCIEAGWLQQFKDGKQSNSIDNTSLLLEGTQKLDPSLHY